MACLLNFSDGPVAGVGFISTALVLPILPIHALITHSSLSSLSFVGSDSWASLHSQLPHRRTG